MDEINEKVKVKRRRRKKESGKTETDIRLEPLRTAAMRIAYLLCAISEDDEIFISDADSSPNKKVDTKTLKEITSVIKELSSVICELNGIENDNVKEVDGVKIEFDSEGEKYSN